MKNIFNKLFSNMTTTGFKTTLLGIVLMVISIYGILFIKETPIEDEHFYMKIMYTIGAIGVLLLLVPDNFINILFEVLKKWLQNKADKNTIILIAVLLTGIIACNITKPLIITHTKDSIVYKEHIKWDTLKIGADTAQITIYISDTSFIHDTIYSTKNGRATVVTKIKDGVMTNIAYCDSAEKAIASIITVMELYRQENTELREQAKKSYWYWWLSGGFALGIISIILLKRLT